MPLFCLHPMLSVIRSIYNIILRYPAALCILTLCSLSLPLHKTGQKREQNIRIKPLFLLSQIFSMTDYCDREESNLEILRDLHAFSTTEWERMCLECRLSVCLSISLYALPASARTVGRSLFICGIKNLSIICLSLVNMIILA